MTEIDRKLFERLLTPELGQLRQIFERYNFELRIAGGAVRDLLMNQIPTDVDFATTATPDQMVEFFNKESIKMFNTNGLRHGTVTVRINDKENFEITTLRIDVRTDGRHADVEFTTDWMLDANRRDLTINSLFLDLNGKIYDYFNGVQHIKDRIVKFVGDATIRIQEDYLRILRYFRFFAVMGAKDHDPDVLKAIRENASGLAGISGERIWVELKKIFIGPNAPDIISTMNDCELFKYIGLEKCNELNRFREVYDRAIAMKPTPITVICALMDDESQLAQFHRRVKLSNEERDIALLVLQYRNGPNPLKFYLDLAVDMEARRLPRIQEKIGEIIKYDGDSALLQELLSAPIPKFPVNGIVLAATAKIPKGRMFGRVLDVMRQRWKDSNFKLTQEELLDEVNAIVEEIQGDASTATANNEFVLSRKRKRVTAKQENGKID